MPGPDLDGDPRPVVLLTFRYFSETHDAQGPTQSLLRMVEALKDRFRFRVVSLAMAGEAAGQWHEAFGVERFGIARGPRGLIQLQRLLRREPGDLQLFSSFFDPQLTIAPLVMRKLRLVPKTAVSIAPRGEFSPGALALNPLRKRVYLFASRLVRLFKGVTFQATDRLEAEAIRAELPEAETILIAPNIRTLEPLPPHQPRSAGEPLRIAFLSRIDRKKNLDVALRLLGESAVPVRFDIFGPAHDPAYWKECQALIAAASPIMSVRYAGPVPATEVVRTLAGYDLFLLPTAGENFGHAIVDALFAGTPVLISDQTPWKSLAKHRAGADLPLGERQAWLDWVRRFADMSEAELTEWRAGARGYIEAALSPEKDAQTVRETLEKALRAPAASAAGSAAT